MTKNIIILLGLPGSGKGTQGGFLSRKLGISHVSTGHILRQMILQDTKDSELLNNYITEGKLVPSKLVNRIVREFILSESCKNGCILDGYPRNLEQAEYLTKNVNADISTIFFDASNEIVSKRILGRIYCALCDKIYNKYFDRPTVDGVCNQCGSKRLVSRSDDDKDIIISRLKEYEDKTLPLVNYYKDKGKFFIVRGGDTKQKVTEELSSIIKKI